MNQVNNDWNNVAPHLLDYSYAVPKEQLNDVSQRIRDHFHKNEIISNKNYDNLVQVRNNINE